MGLEDIINRFRSGTPEDKRSAWLILFWVALLCYVAPNALLQLLALVSGVPDAYHNEHARSVAVWSTLTLIAVAGSRCRQSG